MTKYTYHNNCKSSETINEGEDDCVNLEAPAAAPPTSINTSEKSSLASSPKPLAETEIDKLVPEPFS